MRLKSPSADLAATGEKPTAYRTLGALTSGVLMIVFGLAGVIAFGFGSEKHPLAASISAALAVAGFVGGLYPAAFSYSDRLVVRNPFRTIVLAWPNVGSVVARLSLIVTAEEDGADGTRRAGKSFTVWAIPVSLRERRKFDRSAAKVMRASRTDAMRMAKFATNTDSMVHGGRGSGLMRGVQGVDAIETQAFADQAVREMRDRKDHYREAGGDGSAVASQVRWTWWTLAPVVLVAVLIVVAAAGVFK
jgi:hypothetical protein